MRRWLPMVVCLALVGFVVVPNMLAGLRPYDSGIASSAATFTLHGLLPYRDYWLLYGPLSGLLLALPTALAGPSVELIRVVGITALLAQAVAAYSLARLWGAAGAAIAITVSAIVMYPVLLGPELSAWSLAMTLALFALAVSAGTNRPGFAIGVLVGLTFLARLDVGVYALIGTLVIRDRRTVLLGFAVIAVPFALVSLITTDLASLSEQLVWFPLIGQRLFRALPGPEAVVGQPTAAILSIPLLVVPRLAIVLGIAHLGLATIRKRRVVASRELLGLLVFAGLCQLQTLQGRTDLEHYAQAATPAILLFAIWYREPRPSAARFAGLAAVAAMCVAVGLLSVKYFASSGRSDDDRAIEATSAWIHEATTVDEPIFVGLTSHRYTVMNPLLIYYLSGRRAGVHDAMFNPGVTNTDSGQERMVGDLDRSATRYLVLDRSMADLHEESNDSRIPGSTRLDTYIAANFHVLCDLEPLVIMVRNEAELPPSPACPSLGP